MAHILYVSYSKRGASHYYGDASARYRCIFPAEALEQTGADCHVIHKDDLHKIVLNNYKTIIFHRPQFSKNLAKTVLKAKRENIECIADYDDLLFDTHNAIHTPAVRSGSMTQAMAKKQAKQYHAAARLFNHIQVSSDTLKAMTLQLFPQKNVSVKYNQIPERWVKLAQLISPEERHLDKVIRYLPGTSHHKSDFIQCCKLLDKAMRVIKDLRVEIVGDLNINFENAFSTNAIHKVSILPFVAYEQLPSLYASSWLTIAPLENNLFNQCKSGLKFWESGIFGVPVISSPLGDIERFSNQGLLVSNSYDKWMEFILNLTVVQNYKQSCYAAKEKAQQAVINQPNIKNAQYQHLYMLEKYGPYWPALRFNPTLPQNMQRNIQRHYILASEETNQYKISQLLNNASTIEAASYLNKKTISTTKFIRKAKKLFNSPSLFIRDAKLVKLIKKVLK